MSSDLAIPRMAESDEITRLLLFVASDEASFSTGSECIADGGDLLGPVPRHERAANSTTVRCGRRLGITRIQLYTRLRKHGLDAPAESS